MGPAALLVVASPAGGQTFKFFDDGDRALLAVQNAGVIEPSVPLYHQDMRVVGPGGQPDLWDIVESYDRVPGTGSYPLTWADIIANGYIRPLVQHADGLTGSIGTSVVTQPAFRPVGRPLDTVPDVLRTDVDTAAQPVVFVVGTADYAGRATLTCRREYLEPDIGRTQCLVTYTWAASQEISLAGAGFDAFRLAWFSSMFADGPGGVYDARYLGIRASATAPPWIVRLDGFARGGHLFVQPRPIGVGGGVTLFKDNAGTWNPGSPSIEIRMVGASAPVGSLGVQGYLASTTNPNDDSLSVWVEWIDAPDVIAAGTTLSVGFLVTATDPTDPGDITHDGQIDIRDAWRILALEGRTPQSPDFDGYADLDSSDLIDRADYDIVVASLPRHPADLAEPPGVDGADFFAFLDLFVGGDPLADVTHDGGHDAADFFAFLDVFVTAGP